MDAELRKALTFVYAVIAPGQDAAEILRQNPERRRAAHRALYDYFRSQDPPATQRPPYVDIHARWEEPDRSRAVTLLESMWEGLRQFDYLLPGDWLPPTPPATADWLGRARTLPVTDDMIRWAGEVARARSLLDLKHALHQLRNPPVAPPSPEL